MRRARSRPVLTASIILTLALGIGASASVFSLVAAVLLRPLPFPDADRLVRVSAVRTDESARDWPVSFPEYADWSEQNRSFAAIGAATDPVDANINCGDETLWVRSVWATASLFHVLSVPPVLGRTFSADEDRPGGPKAIVLGHGIWQRCFASDPAVLGKSVVMANDVYQVISVMPPRFSYPDETDVWVPLGPTRIENRRVRGLWVLGRLRQGTTLATARDDMAAIARRLALKYPASNARFGVRLEFLRDSVIGGRRLKLYFLLGAVCLLFLIACTNVGSILLTRGVARRRDSAVLFALGATPSTMLRQILVENAILVVVALATGILVCLGLTKTFQSLASAFSLDPSDVQLNGSVLLFASVAACLAVAWFSAINAMQLRGLDIASHLRGSGCSPDIFRAQRIGGVLIIAQFAFSTALLLCSSLLMRSLINISRLDLGFHSSKRITFKVLLTGIDPRLRSRAITAVLEDLEAIPGVLSVGAADGLPIGSRLRRGSFAIEGVLPLEGEQRLIATFGCMTRGYSRVLGVPVLYGREFERRDDAEETSGIVVINEAMAQHFFAEYPARPPMGRTLRGWADKRYKIIGVIGNVPRETVTAPSVPEVYVNCAHSPPLAVTYVLHVSSYSAAAAGTIRRRLRQINSGLAVSAVATMDEVVSRSMANSRATAAILASFAAVSLLLAAIGIYGLMSYVCQQRTAEIGIRLALGADRLDIVGSFLRHALVLSGFGVALGVLIMLIVGSVLDHLLFGVSSSDRFTTLSTSLVMMLVSLGAGINPVWRAAQLDPASALRAD